MAFLLQLTLLLLTMCVGQGSAAYNSSCQTIVVTDIKHQDVLAGGYELMPRSTMCANRQVYQQLNRAHYIYYTINADLVGWVISSSPCDDEVSVAGESNDTIPGQTNTLWHEYRPIVGTWEPTDVQMNCLGVSAYNSSCQTILVSDVEHQNALDGEYELMPRSTMCANRQVYQERNRAHYIYFTINANLVGWVISSSPCDNEYALTGESIDTIPGQTNTLWLEFRPPFGEWEPTDVEIGCVDWGSGTSVVRYGGATLACVVFSILSRLGF